MLLTAEVASAIPAKLKEKPLSEEEQRFYTLFCIEYVKDYSSIKSCLRLGVRSSVATSTGKKLLATGFVQRMLYDMEGREFTSEELMDLAQRTMRRLTRATLYSENEVAAMTQLSKILQMDKTAAKLPEDTSNVMIVPEIKDVDAWELQAHKSQAQLKQEVRQ